jgi:threonine dehydrogenase-like Zn-dependent dehydrogenase
VRIPHADGTVVKAPSGVSPQYLVLMGDIFPTGYFAAQNAFKNATAAQIAEQTVVIIGCGPVGLCALINALEYKPKHVLAVDCVPSRLDLARSLGAESWDFKNDREALERRVSELTNGRGADAVIEVVGMSPALRMGFELLRPWGVISSVGVHNGEVCCCLHLGSFISNRELLIYLRLYRFPGQEVKPTERMSLCKWGGVPCDRCQMPRWRY